MSAPPAVLGIFAHPDDETSSAPLKIQAWPLYRSQADAQEIADRFERTPILVEAFHQAYPPRPAGPPADDLGTAR